VLIQTLTYGARFEITRVREHGLDPLDTRRIVGMLAVEIPGAGGLGPVRVHVTLAARDLALIDGLVIESLDHLGVPDDIDTRTEENRPESIDERTHGRLLALRDAAESVISMTRARIEETRELLTAELARPARDPRGGAHAPATPARELLELGPALDRAAAALRARLESPARPGDDDHDPAADRAALAAIVDARSNIKETTRG